VLVLFLVRDSLGLRVPIASLAGRAGLWVIPALFWINEKSLFLPAGGCSARTARAVGVTIAEDHRAARSPACLLRAA